MLRRRVLVVDDSRVFLDAAIGLIDEWPNLKVVGQASSGAMALTMVNKLRPHVVLTDLAMPDMDGLTLTKRMRALSDPPAVIIMSAHDHPQYRSAALAAGALGFISKSNLWTELPDLIATLDPPAPEADTEA